MKSTKGEIVKVWLAIARYGEDWHIVGIFSSEEKASQVAETIKTDTPYDCDIECWELDTLTKYNLRD